MISPVASVSSVTLKSRAHEGCEGLHTGEVEHWQPWGGGISSRENRGGSWGGLWEGSCCLALLTREQAGLQGWCLKETATKAVH